MKNKEKFLINYQSDPNNEMVRIELTIDGITTGLGCGNEWDQDVKTYSVLEKLTKELGGKFKSSKFKWEGSDQ